MREEKWYYPALINNSLILLTPPYIIRCIRFLCNFRASLHCSKTALTGFFTLFQPGKTPRWRSHCDWNYNIYWLFVNIFSGFFNKKSAPCRSTFYCSALLLRQQHLLLTKNQTNAKVSKNTLFYKNLWAITLFLIISCNQHLDACLR